MARLSVVALLALTGCHREDEITIINAGAEPVLVRLEWRSRSAWEWKREDDRHAEVPAGGVFTQDVGEAEVLDVLVLRKSDGLVLLADDFEQDDFEDDHGHIEITVAP